MATSQHIGGARSIVDARFQRSVTLLGNQDEFLAGLEMSVCESLSYRPSRPVMPMPKGGF